MASSRETAEDLIISALQVLLKSSNPANGYLRSLDEYNGEVDESDGSLDDLRRLLMGRSPAVLVSAIGGTLRSQSITKRGFRRELEIELYFVSSHLRSRESRLRSDVSSVGDPTKDPGIYQIMEDVHDILAGQTLGSVVIAPLIPLREDPIVRVSDFTVWRVRYETKVDASVKPHDYGDGQPLSAYSVRSQIDGHPVDESPNPIVTADGNH